MTKTRKQNQYTPWIELNITEIEYWKMRHIEQSKELAEKDRNLIGSRTALGLKEQRIQALNSKLENALCNLELREKELSDSIDDSDETRWVYWRKMYTNERDTSEEKIQSLQTKLEYALREVEVLRQWGNKDCTAMADEVLESMGKE